MTSARTTTDLAQGAANRRGTVLLVGLFVVLALMLRVFLSYHAVFGQDFVAFLEPDAWYHMRLVDATVRHFPHRLWYDAYLVHPGGEAVNAGPFFDWVIAAAALIAGLGAPSARLVDIVGAYVPTVFGALTCVPVYVLGRQLFSRSAGLWASFIVGILPGEILHRSILGYTDHHCAETFLTTCVMMAVVCAFSASSARSAIRWSTIGGIALGCYLLTWGGGALVVAILTAWSILELVTSRLRGDSGAAVLRALVPSLLLATVMIAAWIGTRPYFLYDAVALMGSAAVALVLWLIARLTLQRSHGHWWYLLAVLAGATAASLLGIRLLNELSGLRFELGRFSPSRSVSFVNEATPLIHSALWHPVPLWGEFGTALVLAVAAILCQTITSDERWILPTTAGSHAGRMRLLLVWTAVMLAATFGQVRFTYYLAVNVALLAGLASAQTLDWIGRVSSRLVGSPPPVPSKGSRGVRQPWIWPVAARVLLGALILAPTLGRASEDLRRVGTPAPDWYDALIWMGANTPEPFEDKGEYFRVSGEANHTEAEGYGIMAWWDYGYWITRIAHRIPTANPRQTNVTAAASFMVAEDPAAAATILDELNSRYVIVNWELQASVPTIPEADKGTLFGIIATLASRNPLRYCERVETRKDDGWALKTYCYPAYYRTMAIRLYAFGGGRVVPRSVNVIRLAPRKRRDTTRRLLQETSFATQAEAEAFIRLRPLEDWRIASDDPLVSCTTLEPLVGFRPVFRSMGVQPPSSGLEGPSIVQVYEYSGRAGRPTRNESRGTGG